MFWVITPSQLPTLRWIVLLSSSGPNNPRRLGMFGPEDEGNTPLFTTRQAVDISERLGISVAPLREPRISKSSTDSTNFNGSEAREAC